MKRQVVLAFVAVLAVGSAVQASSSFDVTLGTLAAPDNVALGIDGDFYVSGYWLSYADAAASNGSASQMVQTDPDPSMLYGAYANTPIVGVTATVIGPNASATAMTGPGSLSVSAAATTGASSSAAQGYAQQQVSFYVLTGGQTTFSLDYIINQTLSLSPGELGSVDASVGLSLYRADGTQIGAEQLFYIFNDAAGVYSYNQSLSVTGDFEADEMGIVVLRVDGNATAVVPVPGAALLGLIGAGFVGYCRRRLAL